MVWLRSQNSMRARERDYGFAPTHDGDDFESMVQAFTAGYGVFGAKPLGDDRAFAWATDLRTSGTLTVAHSAFQSPWQVRTLDETPQHLAFYIPHTGSVQVSVGKRVVEGGAGRIIIANNHEVGDRVIQGEPHRSDCLCLDWKVVRRTLFSLLETPTLESLDLEPVVDLATPSGRLIGNLAQTIVQGMRNGGPLLSSPLAVSTMSETLADLVIRFAQHRLSGHFQKGRCRRSLHGMSGAPSTICTPILPSLSPCRWWPMKSGFHSARCRRASRPSGERHRALTYARSD